MRKRNQSIQFNPVWVCRYCVLQNKKAVFTHAISFSVPFNRCVCVSVLNNFADNSRPMPEHLNALMFLPLSTHCTRTHTHTHTPQTTVLWIINMLVTWYNPANTNTQITCYLIERNAVFVVRLAFLMCKISAICVVFVVFASSFAFVVQHIQAVVVLLMLLFLLIFVLNPKKYDASICEL